MGETRKLAAILVSDVVGYSRLAGADEDRILARLRTLRSDLIDPTIAVHHGRIVKRTGDGSIVEFRSVVDAVRCAIEVQNGMRERNAGVPDDQKIQFRLGIHLGDVVEEADGDLMGDGVNIAARLESLAEPGGVCLSAAAYEQVRDRLEESFVDLGDKKLKNIARPIRVYHLMAGHSVGKSEASTRDKSADRLWLPDKPSIAVLPFQNMSGDPEQEYFADGMVEDITTALSRFRQLFVIARNSSFTYKGRAVDVKQVGKELGVRYILEGGVRKAANRVRITGQLIDVSTGAHLWADRFDGDLSDMFDLQDQVTASVVGAIAPKLELAEIERSQRKPPESLDAYDYYLRGMASINKWTRESTDEALHLFNKAAELDGKFASAYGMAAWCFVWRKANGWMNDRSSETSEAARLARLAIDLGPDDAIVLAAGGYALAFVAHDLDAGAVFLNRALELNPNLAWALIAGGWVKAFLGESEAAIRQLTYAMRLSPLDPHAFRAEGGMGLAHFLAERDEEAILWAERALARRPNFLPALRELAAASAYAGRPEGLRRAGLPA
jgi:adenylate cyclase